MCWSTEIQAALNQPRPFLLVNDRRFFSVICMYSLVLESAGRRLSQAFFAVKCHAIDMYDKASVPDGMPCHQSRPLACFSPSSVAAWLSLHFDNVRERYWVTAMAPHPQPDQNWQLASVGWSLPPSCIWGHTAREEKRKGDTEKVSAFNYAIGFNRL